jgi:Tumour-associated protein
MMMLLKAIIAFFILVYIHISYSQTPATCLEHLKTEGWPRDGILRVEILRRGEKVPIKEGAEDMSDELTMPRSTHKSGIVSIDPSTTLPEEQLAEANKKLLEFESTMIEGVNGSIIENMDIVEQNKSEEIEISVSEIISSTSTASAGTSGDAMIQMTDSELNTKETYDNESIARISDEEQYEEILKQDIPEVEKLMNAVMPDDQYIVECELKFIIN